MSFLERIITESVHLPSVGYWEKTAKGYSYSVPSSNIKCRIEVSKNKDNVVTYNASVTGLPKGNAERTLFTLQSAYNFCVKAVSRAHLSEIAMPVTPIDFMLPPISEWHEYNTKSGKSWSYTTPDSTVGYLINDIRGFGLTNYAAYVFEDNVENKRKLGSEFRTLEEAFQECEIDWQTKKREMNVAEAEEFPEFPPIKRWQHSTNLYTLNIAGLRYEITFDKHSESREIWGAYVEPRSRGNFTDRLGNYFDFDKAYNRCKEDYENRMKNLTNESINYRLYNPATEEISKTVFSTLVEAYSTKTKFDIPMEVITSEGVRVGIKGDYRGKLPIDMITEVKYEKYWAIEGNYGYGDGWEEVTAETTYTDARNAVKNYRENEPGVPFRIKLKRQKVQENIAPEMKPVINPNKSVQRVIEARNKLKEESSFVSPNDAVYHTPGRRIPGKTTQLGSGNFGSNLKRDEMRQELGHEDEEMANAEAERKEQEKAKRWSAYTNKLRQDNIDRLHTFDWAGVSEDSRKKLVSKYGINSVIDWQRFARDLNRMKLHYPVYLNSYEPDYINEAQEVTYIHYPDWVKAVKDKYKLSDTQFKSMTHILGDAIDDKMSKTGKHLEVREPSGKVIAKWFNHRGTV